MKRFEVFGHTADIGGRAYGKDITELLKNAAELLYFLSGVVWSKGRGKVYDIKISAECLEELLVKFLNELIYYMDVKKIAGDIKKLSIQEEKGMLNLYCTMDMKAVSIKREIKAATYHNLKIKEAKGMLSVDIIFDI
ncbi:MAG: archease [Candidatus Ratteibacteria bacterium]|nr:archease [Candidatus Ratteibacteria bacterium]